MKHASQKTVENILVVNVNWIGDVIFSSPVFKALKETYPHARICCLAVPRVYEVLESVPFVDEIIVYDEKGRHWGFFAKIKLVLSLRRHRFDGAFLLHRSWTRAFLVWLAGIPRRVGYDAKNRGKLLTHEVEPLEGPIHRCDYYLNVIESFGIAVADRQTRLKVVPEAEKSMKEMLESEGVREDDYVVVINPGGNWDLKRWPPKNFLSLINSLCAFRGVRVVISGAPKDSELFKENIHAEIGPVIHLAGKTNLKQMIALMKRADLVISADSGPLHIANSLGTEVIALFGPTRPEITGPRGPGRVHILQHDVGCNREACYHLTCPDNVCMQSIMAAEVLEIVKQIRQP